MFKKCLFWVVPLVLILGAQVAAAILDQAKVAPPGRYVGQVKLRQDGTPRTLSVTLTKTSKEGQLLIAGQITQGDERPFEVRGTYYTAKNRFAAFAEMRSREQEFVMTLDGAYNGSGFDLKMKAKMTETDLEYLDELQLYPAGDTPNGQPVITVTINPNAIVSGLPVTGKAKITVTNPGLHKGIGVIGFIQSGGVGKSKMTNGNKDIFIPLNGNEAEVDLADLSITAPPSSEDDALGLRVSVGGVVKLETKRVDIERPANLALEIINFRMGYAPHRVVATGKISLTLDYRLQNLRSTASKFTITEKVSFYRDNDAPVVADTKTWSGEAPSLQQAGKGADVGPLEVRFPGVGVYTLDYEITGPGVIPVKGSTRIVVERPQGFGLTGGGGGTSTTTGGGGFEGMGSVGGAVKLSKGMVKPGELVDLTATYGMSGRSDADVSETIELVGPGGGVIQTSSKTRWIDEGEEITRRFMIEAYEPGTYTVRLRVNGEKISPFETLGSFEVEKKAASGGGGTTSTTGGAGGGQGTYGLVKKEIGHAASPGTGPYNTMSGTITESSVKIIWTAIRDYVGTFTFESTLSTPPTVLKPGDIVEMTNTATANASDKNQPYNSASTQWYVTGADEILETKGAFAGWASDGKFYSSGAGKLRFKVGSGGTIKISSGFGGMLWGGDGAWNPCIYTYQWNAPPTVKPGDGSEDAGGSATGTTSMSPLDPEEDEEEAHLSAFLEPASLTLKAGEISQIVNIHISGFRTNTDDRVDVIFPEKTDNWASLPGQIVVGGGDGSYWPPNMGRPEHVDGYFFSARSTAPSSKQTVTIIVRQKKAGQVTLKLDVTVVGKGGSSGGTTGGFRGGPWAGDWDTNFGAMTLKQDRDMVSGKFGDADVYEIAGKVDELTFNFKVFDGTNEIGSGAVTMAADGQSWSGTWTYFGESEKHEWKGKRKTEAGVGRNPLMSFPSLVGIPFLTFLAS
jgi:hypothetical protein